MPRRFQTLAFDFRRHAAADYLLSAGFNRLTPLMAFRRFFTRLRRRHFRHIFLRRVSH
jgi:hypothetical protein